MTDISGCLAAAHRLVHDHPPASTPDRDLWAAQFDAGLAWVQFPEGLGGRGAPVEAQADVDAVLAEAGVAGNLLRNLMGIGMVAPTLVAHRPDLATRFLRPLFCCDELWCQLFSEPGAGSDLAAIATRGELDGSTWTFTGQKVWTSQAHVARWGLLLARTEHEAGKHDGLTMFVIDMHQPGVTVRPLRQMTGDAEFNEVFLDAATTPDSLRVGARGAGWRVASTTLTNERSTLGGLSDPNGDDDPVTLAMRLGSATRHAALRQRLVAEWMRGRVNRWTVQRARAAQIHGTPGPEGAIGKLAQALASQRAWNVAIDCLGAEGMLISDYTCRRPDRMGGAGTTASGDIDITKSFLQSQGGTIGGGTSEIARNVIAERVLGLPREPRP